MTTIGVAGKKASIYVGDCRKVLAKRKQIYDLIFADPPFNWEVKYDLYHDKLSPHAYLAFTYEWLDACVAKLANRGSLWINIPDEWVSEIDVYLKGKGLIRRDWVIWHFRFGQNVASKFICSKTHVLHYVKQEDYIWNPDDVRVPSDRATKYKDVRTTRTPTPGMRLPLDVWYGEYLGRVQGGNAERIKLHRNQLPEMLLSRIVRSTSNKGSMVLDPFCGSGTTGVVACELGREFRGIDISERYARSAATRIHLGPARDV